jgi:bacterioferritin-associated ferredoxin
MKQKNKKPEKLICLCNSISEKTIKEAIRNGAKSLGEIFDTTGAGVGACGGSCRPDIKKCIEEVEKEKN